MKLLLKIFYFFFYFVDSLNLRSYLMLLACITPYQKDSSQTLSTLRFTASAKLMKITPHLNAIINNYRVIIQIVFHLKQIEFNLFFFAFVE